MKWSNVGPFSQQLHCLVSHSSVLALVDVLICYTSQPFRVHHLLLMSPPRRDLEYTYRHDLESFFYVFLAMCIDYGCEEGKRPKVDPLQSWYIGSYDSIVGAKLGHMGLNGFETLILPKFSPAFECVKGLAMSLRDALFLRDGKLRTGTPAQSPSVLYNQMIAAFDKAIASLEDCSTTSRQ